MSILVDLATSVIEDLGHKVIILKNFDSCKIFEYPYNINEKHLSIFLQTQFNCVSCRSYYSYIPRMFKNSSARTHLTCRLCSILNREWNSKLVYCTSIVHFVESMEDNLYLRTDLTYFDHICWILNLAILDIDSYMLPDSKDMIYHQYSPLCKRLFNLVSPDIPWDLML